MSNDDVRAPLNTRWLEAFAAKPAIAELLVGASALLAYIGTLTFDFVYDDVLQIVQNPAVQNWGSTLQYFHQDVWAGLGTQGAATFYRPVFMLWLRLNDAVFGLRPYGWHVSAVVLHVIAAVLVCRLAARLTQSRAAGCAVGMLFALHPVHVESVAWVSGATDTLLAVFLCGAVLCYMEFVHEGKYRFLAWSVVLAWLALLTKETAVLLPLLVGASLLSEEGGWKRLKRAKSLLIFVVLVCFYLILRLLFLHSPPPVLNMTIGQMIMTWPVVLVFYLGQLVLPLRLSPFRDLFPVQSASEPRFLGALVLLIAISAALYWWARSSSRRGLILTGSAWFLVPLLPVLNLRVLNPGQLVPDRYLYLPSIGFSLLVVAAGIDIAGRFYRSRVWRFRSSLVVAISLVYVVLVVVNQRVWANNLLFFKHSVEIAPRNAIANKNLGVAYALAGDLDQGISWLERAVRLDPKNADFQFNLALVYYENSRLREAYQHNQRSLELNPQNPQGWLLASKIAFDSGDNERALASAQIGERAFPDGPGFRTVVGYVLLRRGDRYGAAQAFREELLLHPDDQEARSALEQLNAGR